MAVRTELYCTFCGHSAGDVAVATTRRPTNRELRAAYEAQRPSAGPLWIGDQPRCPRCKGQLFLEGFERSALRRAG